MNKGLKTEINYLTKIIASKRLIHENSFIVRFTVYAITLILIITTVFYYMLGIKFTSYLELVEFPESRIFDSIRKLQEKTDIEQIIEKSECLQKSFEEMEIKYSEAIEETKKSLDDEEIGSKSIPVLLGVSAPRAVRPGNIFIARFVAYIEALEEKVRQELFNLSRGKSESFLGLESCRWKTGTHVTVKLSGEKYLIINPPEREFVWNGEKNRLDFKVEVLPDAPEGSTYLMFDVFIGGIKINPTSIGLEFEISSKAQQQEKENFISVEPARTAFASYSSLDRERVLDRLAAVRISAGLDIFLDCLSLHPGDEWKSRLAKEIQSRDIFLLFWSKNAINSEWVTWEWKTALERKNESKIQIHPLQSVSEAPPPDELKKFHFGDIFMTIRDSQRRNY